MMKTCGTCKHWGAGHNEHEKAGESVEKDDIFKPCGAVVQVDKFVADARPAWSKDTALRASLEEVRARKAVVVDGSDYFAALKTQSDFGCLLHEDKP